MSEEPGVYIINQNPDVEIKNIERAQNADEVYQIISNRNHQDSVESLDQDYQEPEVLQFQQIQTKKYILISFSLSISFSLRR